MEDNRYLLLAKWLPDMSAGMNLHFPFFCFFFLSSFLSFLGSTTYGTQISTGPAWHTLSSTPPWHLVAREQLARSAELPLVGYLSLLVERRFVTSMLTLLVPEPCPFVAAGCSGSHCQRWTLHWGGKRYFHRCYAFAACDSPVILCFHTSEGIWCTYGIPLPLLTLWCKI